MTVAIFCKRGYWNCHTPMGIDSLGKRAGLALLSFFNGSLL